MGTLVFQANLGGSVNLIGPNTASTVNFTLPSADGTNGQALVTNGSGTLSFSSFVSSAAGSNTQVQFNSGGAFAGSANLTFDGTTLTAAGLSGPHNGSVGATTPSTGAFTTLSASSTITFSGGTANGVLYLNGSKVATAGSALTFDGSNLGAPNGQVFSSGAFSANSDGSGSWFAQGIQHIFRRGSAGSYQTVFTLDTSGNAIFAPLGTEAMRLTSTGLGIGTSSPGAKLDVAGGSTRFQSSGGYVSFGDNGYVRTDVSGWFAIQQGSNGFQIRDSANASARLIFDSNYNLGLGVTPSSWGSGVKAFQVSGGGLSAAVYASSSGLIGLTNNYYNNGGDIYAANGYATRYYQYAGQHVWNIAPSGTAGNAITFTQALTLDANGKLLVGLTSSASTSADLQVNAPISLKGYTVAGLPTGTLGDIAYVTDALAPSFLATIVGGGAIKTPVFYNGTNWVAY